MTKDLSQILKEYFEVNMNLAFLLLYGHNSSYEEAYNEMYTDRSNNDHTLISLISFYCASATEFPISTALLNMAFEEYERYSAALDDQAKIEKIFSVLEGQIHIQWLEKTKQILIGKLASLKSEYSTEAGIYFAQKMNRGPISYEQKTWWSELQPKIFPNADALQTYLDEQASSFAFREKVNEEIVKAETIDSTVEHDNFVLSLNDGTLEYKVLDRNKFSQIIFDSAEKRLMLVLLILTLAPLFIVPTICVMSGNWLYLLGLVGAFLGMSTGGIINKTSKPIKQLVELGLCQLFLSCVLFYFLGIESIWTVISLLMTYEFIAIGGSDIIYESTAKNNLLKFPSRYYEAVNSNFLKVQYQL